MKDGNKDSEHEIDLLMLLKRSFDAFYGAVSVAFSFGLKVVSYLLLFGIKRWVILGVFLILGSSFGAYTYYFNEKSIVSDMVLRNNEVSNDEIITILEELSVYAKQNNSKALAKKMALDTAITKHIKSINAYWFIDEDDDGVADYVDFKREFNQLDDTIQRRVPKVLDVRVHVQNSEVISQLEGGLLHYLESNNILKRLNNSRTNLLKTLISKTTQEIDQLDSLQSYEYFVKERKADIDFGSLGRLRIQGEEKDTRLLHEQILSLEEKRLGYESQLDVYGDIISVLSGFAISEKPEKSLFNVMIKQGLILSFFGYILLFLLGHRKAVLEFLEDKSK